MPMTCEWCGDDYSLDAETRLLQGIGSWKADYCLDCRDCHFVCEGCASIVHMADRHPSRPRRCVDCPDPRSVQDQDPIDAARCVLDLLANSLIRSGDLTAIWTAAAALVAIRRASTGPLRAAGALPMRPWERVCLN
jgi:hypothetical protein